MSEIANPRQLTGNVVNLPELLYTTDDKAGSFVNTGGELLEKISGAGGFQYFGTTAQTNKLFKSIVINQDAVFSVLSVSYDNGATSANYMTIANLATFPISAGTYLPAPAGGVFTTITLASGSAIGYL